MMTWFNWKLKPRAKLPYSDFRNKDLSEVDLRMAKLCGSDFRGADLTKACLLEADLTDCDFKGAILDHADFRHAQLKYADISFANMWYSDVLHADFRWVRCLETHMTGINFRGTRIDNMDLIHVDIASSHLSTCTPFINHSGNYVTATYWDGRIRFGEHIHHCNVWEALLDIPGSLESLYSPEKIEEFRTWFQNLPKELEKWED